MNETEESIPKLHNNFFVKLFSEPENVSFFLNMTLPQDVKEALDLSKINIDFTSYISPQLKDKWSDLVAKVALKTPSKKLKDANIYFLVEHKSNSEKNSLMQVLGYMHSEWQKDVESKRDLRPIIPLIFYHGKNKWNRPRRFVDQFKVDDSFKRYMLNYNYLFFDTADWDFMAPENSELKENVFLFTALVLMKNAYNNDMDVVREILKFWHKKGFTKEKERILLCLNYIYYTKDITYEKLEQAFEESKIEGGNIMPSLAQRLKEEGKEQGIEIGLEKGIERGIERGKIETAKRLMNLGVDIDTIKRATELTEENLKKIAETIH